MQPFWVSRRSSKRTLLCCQGGCTMGEGTFLAFFNYIDLVWVQLLNEHRLHKVLTSFYQISLIPGRIRWLLTPIHLKNIYLTRLCPHFLKFIFNPTFYGFHNFPTIYFLNFYQNLPKIYTKTDSLIFYKTVWVQLHIIQIYFEYNWRQTSFWFK